MTVRRPTKAAMIYQNVWAIDMFIGVNMPPMLMLIPPIFMVAVWALASGWLTARIVRYGVACLAIEHSK
jgi:hypothetical protein